MDIHPMANAFPMLTDEELEELTANIQANGLLHPIVMQAGQLIDGRNRLEACKLAQVEPRFVELEASISAVDYILSVNIHRRHLTKGQQAMAYAIAYPEGGGKGGRGKKSGYSVATLFSRQLVDQARLVFHEMPELVEQVKHGGSLKDAHEHADKHRKAREAAEQQLALLQRNHPDYAAKVEAGEWSLAFAQQVIASEQEQAQQAQALQALQAQLQLLQEQIAEEKPVIVPADLRPDKNISPTEDLDRILQVFPSREVMKEEIRFIGLLVTIYKTLREESQKPVIKGGSPSLIEDVKECVSTIIAEANNLANIYNRALKERQTIKRVK